MKHQKTYIVILNLLAICYAYWLVTSEVTAAIDLTTPETIPARVATTAQIMEIRLRFYCDGQNMLMKVVDGVPVGTAEGYVEWRVGNGDAPDFKVVAAGKSINLTSADLAEIMARAKQAKPADTDALVPAIGITPVDQLFQAIIQHLKAKGKL